MHVWKTLFSTKIALSKDLFIGLLSLADGYSEVLNKILLKEGWKEN